MQGFRISENNTKEGDVMLEEMSDFFAERADTYDCHMLEEVGGCRECYCLKKCGVYIECGYMIPDETENAQQIEEYFSAEYKRLYAGKPEGKYFHYDIPCTVLN